MDITITRDALLAAAVRPVAVANAGATLPILSHILLQASDGQLALTGTDLQTAITAHTPAQVDLAGDGAVPGRKLFDLAKAINPGAELRLRLTGDRCAITSGRSRFSLGTLPTSDYPAMEALDPGGTQVHLLAGDLARLLDRTAYAMAKSDVRFYLNGLLLEWADGTLRAVATDGHRMASATLPVAAASGPSRSVILPADSVRELTRALTPPSAPLTLDLTDRLARITIGALTLTSKLVDGRYPEWRRVVPTALDKVVALDRVALLQALSRAGILSNETYRGVRASFEPGVLRLTAANQAQEEAQEEIPIDYAHPPVVIGYNIGYLSDALRAIEADQIELNVADGNSSSRVVVPADPDEIHVVMPMRL